MEIDEQGIREEIEAREYNVEASEDWYTPAGRRRNAPVYEAPVSNEYLGVSKTIKARTRYELEEKVERQLRTWAQQELRRRIAEAKDDLRATAAEATEHARQVLTDIRGILHATLGVDDRLDWEALQETGNYVRDGFAEDQPTLESSREEPVFRPSWLQRVLPPLRRRAEQKFLLAHSQWDREREQKQKAWEGEIQEWQGRAQAHERDQNRRESEFGATKTAKNESIERLRRNFESADPDAIQEYLQLVFQKSQYPDGFQVEHEANYEPASRTVIVDLSLPEPDSLPDTVEFKLVDRSSRLRPIPLKKREKEDLFDRAVKQTVLRTLHEVFESVYISDVEGAVVNGWTTITDRSTGHQQTPCIISVRAERTEFEQFNLESVDPTECIKRLRGLIAGPLTNVAPVQPIMRFDREDSRFVASQDVLDSYSSATNLAEIEWEEFEHLVRELFGRMFSGVGAEVRVTQASRDQGVDAIAFDPDPIRGGKFVIQAKRYTNVVDVSAVRDLYGTMISEGATKGILVTTSHYGRESHSFAKDKPITLIDGSNLVYLLKEHGYDVRIDVEEARRNR